MRLPFWVFFLAAFFAANAVGDVLQHRAKLRMLMRNHPFRITFFIYL